MHRLQPAVHGAGTVKNACLEVPLEAPLSPCLHPALHPSLFPALLLQSPLSVHLPCCLVHRLQAAVHGAGTGKDGASAGEVRWGGRTASPPPGVWVEGWEAVLCGEGVWFMECLCPPLQMLHALLSHSDLLLGPDLCPQHAAMPEVQSRGKSCDAHRSPVPASAVVLLVLQNSLRGGS